MKTLTVKNVPDELHEKLSRLARQGRRSLNGELLVLLEDVVERFDSATDDPEAVLKEIRAVRRRMRRPGLTLHEIQKAIDEGRP